MVKKDKVEWGRCGHTREEEGRERHLIRVEREKKSEMDVKMTERMRNEEKTKSSSRGGGLKVK